MKHPLNPVHAPAEQEQFSSEEYRIRSEKVEKLRARGIEPWPEALKATASSDMVQAAARDGAREGEVFEVVGRLMVIRHHGKSAFATLQDAAGRLQLYFKADAIGDEHFTIFTDLIDIGDIIWARGTPFVTKTGEITLRVEAFRLLSKCLHPLPEKFHGIADIETKYRQRYLDLISSAETKERFLKRSRIVSALRTCLDAMGYVEVETPMLHPIAGGAAARPFVTHHNTLNEDLYLRIAPELYLKRLVVGGIDRVYEINRNFRNEGVSTRHNPEFTMIELYTAYEDIAYAMWCVEELLQTAARAAGGSLQVPYGDQTLNFERPFRRLTMRNAVMEYAGCTEYDVSPAGIDALCAKHQVKVLQPQYGYKLLALFEKFVEPHLVQPTFIHEFPIETSPLAKRDPHNPDFAPRFELFVAGMELSNGYHELNDPFDQAARFRDQLELSAAGDAEAHNYDHDFVTALEHALPPTVGIGIGIDRLVMLMTNTPSIKEVILFPTLKRRS